MVLDQTLPHRDQQLAPMPPDALVIPPGMVLDEFYAMGTTIALLLPEAQSQAASDTVRQLFSEWEQTLSRFRSDSELAQLNQHAGSPVIVSPLFFRVLQTALTAARETDGLYDPTLLNQLLQAGYDRSFDELPLQQPDPSAAPQPGGGWRQIQVDPYLRCVTLPPGIGIDFGGIAKGMAVDAALASLQQLSIGTALVNAGGDLVVLGLPSGYTSWPIEVQGKETSWVIPFHHGALATSSVSRRHWHQGKYQRHHLIDPRTGEPVQSQLWSVTVAASRCMQAEVATKATFLLGIEQGKNFLKEHALAGLLVQNDGSWTTAGNWPAELMKSLKDT
jgi:FAD:protein FMN transferase